MHKEKFTMKSKVEFRISKGEPIILVPVSVNDKGHFDFILDTGAEMSLLSTETAQNAGIPISQTTTALGAGGEISLSFGKVDSLMIGKAKVEDLTVGISDMKELEAVVEDKIDGNIGYNFLKDFRTTINYAENTFSLAKGYFEQIGETALGEIDFRLANIHRPLIVVKVLINDKAVYDFALDTGASNSMISPELTRNFKIKTSPTEPITAAGGLKIDALEGNLDSLSIGKAKKQNAKVIISDFFTMLNQALGTKLYGIIGYDFLKDYKVTIDYPNNKLFLD